MKQRPGIVCIRGEHKPGDQPPTGYADWIDWADVQHKAGLRQHRCPTCRKWRFPQERCCQTQEPALEAVR